MSVGGDEPRERAEVPRTGPSAWRRRTGGPWRAGPRPRTSEEAFDVPRL